MAGFTSTLFLWGGTLALLALCAFYLYVKSLYRYFEKRGISFDKPCFPFGSLSSTAMMKKCFGDVLSDVYLKYKGDNMVGFFSFWKKQILIRDREIIKHILVKDFDIFPSRGMYYNKKKDPISANLFVIGGPEWKILRTKFSPTLTSVKIRGMFSNVLGCAREMINYIGKFKSEINEIESKTLFYRYTLANISNTVFGLDSDCLTNKYSVFVNMARNMLAPTWDRMLTTILMINPGVAKEFNIRLVPKDTSRYFMQLFLDTVKFREENRFTGNDYVQLLIELKNTEKLLSQGCEVSFHDNDLAAQAFMFIVAGSDTVASPMCFCLYEMALNRDIQAKVMSEVDAVQEISYDSVANMEYLEMVVDETLRKYPPLPFLSRENKEDYVVPGTQTVIQKGTQVFVSLLGLHHDPELFPEPEQFIPERFSKENKNNIKPYSYMPFGEGPRFCMGMKFGKLIVKTGIVMVLKHFKVHCTSSTPVSVHFEPLTLMLSPAGGMWLIFEERIPNQPIY